MSRLPGTGYDLNERSNYGYRISPFDRSFAARRSSAAGPRLETRFDRRLAKILVHATDVFYEKGYAAASMRDLSRASGVSLSGLYYYFESKEELLYLIQKQLSAPSWIALRERLEDVSDPAERIRMFILNHLEYFLANQKAMKVLSHEDDVLKNGFGAKSPRSSASTTASALNCWTTTSSHADWNFPAAPPCSACSA